LHTAIPFGVLKWSPRECKVLITSPFVALSSVTELSTGFVTQILDVLEEIGPGDNMSAAFESISRTSEPSWAFNTVNELPL